MSSGLFLAGRFNLRDQIVSVLRHPEEFVRQAVGKSAESRRNNGSFGVFNREVNLVAVDRLIANKPAGCGELLKTRGQFGVLDLVDEGGFSRHFGVHHAFNADPEHRTRRPGRYAGNLLRLRKRLFSVVRHGFCGWDICSHWVSPFALGYNDKPMAFRAVPDTENFRGKELAFILGLAERLTPSAAVVIHVCPWFSCFQKAFQDRVLSKQADNSAVRARHFLCFH